MKTLRNVGICILAVLLAVMAVSYIAKRTNGLKDNITWDKITSKVRNDDNLFKTDNYTLISYNVGNGIKVVANDDGSITINGELQGENDVTIEVGTVSLPAETYSLSTGWNNASLYTGYMKLVDATAYHNFDFGTSVTYSETTAGTIYLVIKPEVKFNNVTLYPVVSEGTVAVDFYE